MVIRPFRLKSSSTIGSFSILAFARIAFASSSVMPSFAVTRFFGGHGFLDLLGRNPSSNFRSRLVMMPTSFLPSVIGTPEIRNFAIRSLASCKGMLRGKIKGICNDAVLRTLYLVHLLGLLLNGHILMDDTDTALSAPWRSPCGAL